MRVVSLCRLPVGIVRWRSPQPTLTVVVKATYTLGKPPGLAGDQLPLGGDVSGELGSPPEVEIPSDFAPNKVHADVLVVGHAHGAPKVSHPFAFQVGGLRRSGQVSAGRTMDKVPLSSQFIHIDGIDGRIGPHELAADGWEGRRVTPTYDFSQFNVAPQDQQMGALASNAPIVLDGLLESTPHYEGQLPVMSPFVFVMSLEDERQPGEVVPMKCDTLWIHTDREICTLTWRGMTRMVDEDKFALAVGTAAGPPPRWGALFERLDVATWSEAEEEPSTGRPDRITEIPNSATSIGLPVLDAPSISGDDEEPDSDPPETPKRGVTLSHQNLEGALGGMVLAADSQTGGSLPFDGHNKEGAPPSVPGAPPLPMGVSAPRDTQELSEDMVAELRSMVGAEAVPPLSGDKNVPFRTRASTMTSSSPPGVAEVLAGGLAADVAPDGDGDRDSFSGVHVQDDAFASHMRGETMPPPPMAEGSSPTAGAPFETAPPSQRGRDISIPMAPPPFMERVPIDKSTLIGGSVPLLRRPAPDKGDRTEPTDDVAPSTSPFVFPQLATAVVSSYDAERDVVTLRVGDRRVRAKRDDAVHPAVVSQAVDRGERVLVEKHGDTWLVVGALRTQPNEDSDDTARPTDSEPPDSD